MFRLQVPPGSHRSRPSATSERTHSRHSPGAFGAIPAPHATMARSTSIGVRAGVGVEDAVVIMTDCKPDEAGVGSQEMAMGLPHDDWQEPRPDGTLTIKAGG